MPMVALIVALLVGACTDSDYDLSDIDTTVGLSVNDLVVPINIDSIFLEPILDLEDDSKVKNVDGEYAVVEEGTFSSEPVNVPSYTASATTSTPIVDELELTPSDELLAAIAEVQLTAGEPALSCSISDESTEISIVAEDVDEALVSVERLMAEPVAMSVVVEFTGLTGMADEFVIDDFKFQFFKGLDATIDVGTYDPETGIIAVDYITTTDHKISTGLQATSIGEESGMGIDEDRTFSLVQECYTLSGTVSVYPEAINSKYVNADGSVDAPTLMADLPEKVSYRCTINIDDVEAREFTGVVKYAIEGIDIEPVALTDIPDVLNQLGTDIRLKNPQIYLALNNPVERYDIYAQAGLLLTSHVGGTASEYEMDEPIVIDEEDNKYCISPTAPASYYVGYEDAEHVLFSTLGDVLSGEQMPSTIDIEVTSPEIPEQRVEGFKLGEDIEAIEGSYVFYAPLQLSADAKVVYTDTIDGWNDEDVDAITITKLVVNANVSTDMPLDIEFKVYPIDPEGNKMYDDGVVVCGTVNTTVYYGMDEPVEVTVDGTITHLDGIIVEARATGVDDSDESLRAEQTIVLTDVKATVSGTYIKEL